MHRRDISIYLPPNSTLTKNIKTWEKEISVHAGEKFGEALMV